MPRYRLRAHRGRRRALVGFGLLLNNCSNTFIEHLVINYKIVIAHQAHFFIIEIAQNNIAHIEIPAIWVASVLKAQKKAFFIDGSLLIEKDNTASSSPNDSRNPKFRFYSLPEYFKAQRFILFLLIAVANIFCSCLIVYRIGATAF